MEGSGSREPGRGSRRRRRREPLWLDTVDAADEPLEWERATPARPRARSPRRPAPARPTTRGRPRREPARRTAVSRAWELQVAGLAIALLLAGLLLLLVVAGDAQFWLSVGGALVAFGLAFDLYARLIGTLAAHEASETAWAIACAVGGSPVVAAHALTGRRGPVAPELDTLAGLLALTFVLALLVASLSGAARG